MKYRRTFPFLYLTLVLCLVMPAPAFTQEAADEPSLKEKKTKEGFLIDLKSLISRSKKKIEEANVKIEEQDLYERNQQREEKAREYFERGMKLYEDGKFDKATEYWERAVKITEHPEMKGYIGASSKRTKKEQKALSEAESRRLDRLEEERGYKIKEVEKTYAKAVSYFKRNKFLQARQAFEEVDKMFPDHKATRSYLMLISQKISEEQKEIIAQKLQEESEEYVEGKENWKQDLEKKAGVRRKQLEEQAEEIYNHALELYKAKQYVAAKERFKEVEWILPDYKATIKYLKKLDSNIKVDEVLSQEDRQRLFEKQVREDRIAGESTKEFEELKKEDRAKEVTKRLEEEAEFVYKSAVSLYKKKNYVEAKDMFMEVEEVLPAYKKTREYLSLIEKKIPEYQRDLKQVKKEEVIVAKETDGEIIKQDVIERREKYAKEAEAKYQEAVAFYKSRNYVEAKIKFIQVEALYPDYLDTRDYLAKIDHDISGQVAKGDERAIRGLQVAWQDETTAQQKGVTRATPSPRQGATVSPPSGDVKALYDHAVELYKDDQYSQAREVFLQVNEIQPGYKGVEKYLNKIYNRMVKEAREGQDQKKTDLVQAQRSNRELFEGDARTIYKEALSLYKQKRFVDARKRFVEVNELVPGYKSTKRYITRLNKLVPSIYYEEEKKSPEEIAKTGFAQEAIEVPTPLNEEAERLYQEAIDFYKEREFSKAKKQFKRVAKLVPDYKMTSVYLMRINKRLGPEAALLESDLEESSEPAIADYDERKLDDKREVKAEAKSEKTLVKSFSEQKAQLKQEEREYEKQKRISAQLKKEERLKDLDMYEDKVGAMYKEAVKLYKDKDYDLAKRKFNAIDTLHPDFKSTRHYMKQIERIKVINEEKERLVKEIEETRLAADEAKKLADELKEKQKQTMKEKERLAVEVPKEPEVQEGVAATDSTTSAEESVLIQRMAEEWKSAEERATFLEGELKEKELALRWRLDQEERIAQLMAQEAELERLEGKKYEDFRKDLQRSYDEEDKAMDASRERIEGRVEELKEDHEQELKTREKAAARAVDELEAERDYFRKQRDLLVEGPQAPTASFKDEIEVTQISEHLLGELEALEKTINEQEMALMKDRKLADERLEREAYRRAELASKRTYDRVTEYPAKKEDTAISFEERYRQLSEEENEQALARLVRSRQRELREERERIRQQFQDSLDDLYNKAVDLHNAGMIEDARRMFNEVKEMAPGYKKTNDYLSKIHETTNSQWDQNETKREFSQDLIHPTPRELKSRDSAISGALDSLEHSY